VTRFTAGDVADIADLLRAASVAEIMPRFRRLGPEAIRPKTGPLDLVTEADEAAEAVIADGLHRRFPGCVVIGEEAASADPGLLRRLEGADLAFVVDPIDGTANFAAGLPLFGVMAAAVVHGEVAMAAIHDPVCGDTALALRGEGAWTEAKEGGRADLRVMPAAAPERMTGVVSWRYLPPDLRAVVCRNLPRLGAAWDYRCAAHEYRMLAAGACHFLVFHRLMPWDHAPGWLLHREAGGFSARFDGSPYRPGVTGGGLICTPDEESWQALRTVLFEG
jgi:fructose-1,6-bisphosphatase/inositol monophosphatase family enzyme